MTQKEKFDQAVNKHRQEQETRNQKGSGFTKIIYAPLYTSENRVFRLTGLPYSVRERPTDCKRVFMSQIVGDDGKKFFCNGPDPEVNKSWLLYRIIGKVMSYEWDNEQINPQTQKKGVRVYNYAKAHPAIFNMVAKNSNPQNTLEKGWRFDPVILMNVIDRSDVAFHKENKKLKVLSKKASQTSSGTIWYDRGFPEMLYGIIMEDIVANFGSWEDYDIVIKKTDKTPFYKAYHSVDDARHFDSDTEIMAQIVKGPMTQEEKSWEGWDFDTLFDVTPYLTIQKKIGDSLRRIDKELKTSFADELMESVAKEEDEKTEAKDAAGSSRPTGATNTTRHEESVVDDGNGDEDEDQGEPQSDPVAATAPASSAPRTRQGSDPGNEKIDVDSILRNSQFKGAHLLTKAEKSWITGQNPDGTLVWSPEAGELIQDADTKEFVPDRVHCNPYSGRIYEQVAA